MEGGRSYSVFFILRAPHRLQLSRPVLIIPRREKKRPSPRGRACVPHRARGARHGTREATHAHTSKRVSRSRPSHFSRRPSQYNPPTSARASGRDHQRRRLAGLVAFSRSGGAKVRATEEERAT